MELQNSTRSQLYLYAYYYESMRIENKSLQTRNSRFEIIVYCSHKKYEMSRQLNKYT